MKKIYSKFTKERDAKFQIETGIFLDNGKKTVVKLPLSAASAAHVQGMYENYVYFTSRGIELFASCKKAEDGVCFEFVEGDTYYNLLLESIQNGKVEQLAKLLEQYRRIVELACEGDTEPFAPTEQFVEVFGRCEGLEGKKACRKLDIDLTMDNLILTEDGNSKIIDYEWIFDFPVPLEFVYYRAVLALYIKHGQELNVLAQQDSLYRMFGIEESDIGVFRQMNEAFNRYVQGRENSYEHALTAYRKKNRKLSDWIKNIDYFAQLFVSSDGSFSEERSLKFRVLEDQRMVRISIDLRPYKEIKMLRVDPLNLPCAIEGLRFEILENKKERDISLDGMRHNAVFYQDGEYVFEDADPQIIWDIPEDTKPDRIWISYELTARNLGENEGAKAVLKAAEENKEELQRELARLWEENRKLKEQRNPILYGLKKCRQRLKSRPASKKAGEAADEEKKD